jgi:hypothetical protein
MKVLIKFPRKLLWYCRDCDIVLVESLIAIVKLLLWDFSIVPYKIDHISAWKLGCGVKILYCSWLFCYVGPFHHLDVHFSHRLPSSKIVQLNIIVYKFVGFYVFFNLSMNAEVPIPQKTQTVQDKACNAPTINFFIFQGSGIINA